MSRLLPERLSTQILIISLQTPNIIVNNLWVENVTRSKAMKEVIELNVSFGTSFEDIELLRLEMEKFVRNPDNSRDFQQNFSIDVGSVNDCDKITLRVTIKHKSNWHNEQVRATRRSKVSCALALACKKIPILGPGGGGEALGGPNNPTYSVAVNDDFASQARTKAAEAADAGRMVPKNAKSDSPVAQGKSEKDAIADLTAQPPLAGMEDDFGYNRDVLEERNDPNPPGLNTSGSTERLRTENLDTVRQDLLRRASTRGRRKAGDGISTISLTESNPGLVVTQPDDASSQATIRSLRQRSFDVESQMGGGSPYLGGLGIASSPSNHGGVSPGVAAAASQSYTIYPQQPQQPHNYSIPGPSGTARGGGGSSSTPVPHVSVPPSVVTTGPEGLATTSQGDRALSPSSPTAQGARRRGASVSQALEDQERQEQLRKQLQGL